MNNIVKKLQIIAENEQKVYDAGKKAEYDALWDMIQDKGNQTDYARAFCGQWRNIEMFKPKYDIIATNAYMIFASFPLEIDLEAYLQSLGVKLDISKADNTNYLFQGAHVTRVGVIDVRGSTGSCPLDSVFANCKKLVTIDKLYIKTGTRTGGKEFSGTFNQCTALENLTIVGVITDSGLNLKDSPKLSKASIESVINALDLGEIDPDTAINTRPQTTITLSKAAVDKAFENSEGMNNGSGSWEWQAFINKAQAAHWTISLV